MRLKTNEKQLWSYLIMFVIILSCQSLISGILGDYSITGLCILTSLFGTMYLVRNGCVISLYKSKKLLCVLFCYIISMFALLMFGEFKYVFFIGVHIMVPTVGIIWLLIGDIRRNIYQLLSCFTNIVCIISVFSLVFYICGTCFDFVKPSVIYSADSIGWANYDYRNFFFLYNDGQYTDIFGYRVIRNIGIFLEAPMYVYVLVIALYFEMFLRKHTSKKVIPLFFAVITSFSTTAICLALVFIFIRFRSLTLKNNLLKYFVCPTVFLVCMLMAGYTLYDKLFTSNLSGITRIDDLIASVKSFLESPIVGNGYMNSRALDVYRTGFRSEIIWTDRLSGLSTGIGGVLSNGGILLGWFYLLPPVFAIKNIFLKKDISELVWNLFILLVFVLNVVTIVYIVAIGPFINLICWGIVCFNCSKFND